MQHGSLFSGIGGFDLAADWMGWQNVFHCEKEKFCQKILKYYWPNAILYDNIINTDFTTHKNKIDILSGGFPCQPFSSAGKRQGTSDDRYLWPEMLRAINEIGPRWVVGENVHGLVNWQGGLVLDKIKTDLENLQYQVFPPIIIPACSVNAPHRRYRVWIIAYSGSKYGDISIQQRGQDEAENTDSYRESESRVVTNAIQFNGEKVQIKKRFTEFGSEYFSYGPQGRNYGWECWPSVHPVSTGNDGLSSKLDGITFSKWRQESMKGGGNAVVPHVAYEIFKTIELFEKR